MRQNLHEIMRVSREYLNDLEKSMALHIGSKKVIDQMEEDLNTVFVDRLQKLGLLSEARAQEVIDGLLTKVTENENGLLKIIGIERSALKEHESVVNIFNKINSAAFKMTTEYEGFFLKLEKAEEILRAYPPVGTMAYRGYNSVDELLQKENIEEVMSALRFTENDEWMHKAFDSAYSAFTFNDFEKRPIQLRVLGSQWRSIAEKFVAKKHHNVSHLKEFGIIFLNPINQAEQGAFLRDFALFFHYFHEIAFYSRLFEYHAEADNFSEKLKSFLRGDVSEKNSVKEGEWLIVQRYLWKLDPNDPRLFLARVNPESLHWRKGEDDLVAFGKKHSEASFSFWDDLDWIGGYFTGKNTGKELVSFDMEDNTMTDVSKHNHEKTYFFYHQQEAIWNELFRRFIGDERRYQLILENFDKGSITF